MTHFYSRVTFAYQWPILEKLRRRTELGRFLWRVTFAYQQLTVSDAPDPDGGVVAGADADRSPVRLFAVVDQSHAGHSCLK